MSPAAAPSVRADLYWLVAELISFPTQELSDRLDSGIVQATVAHLLSHLPERNAASEWPAFAGAADGLESEYIRLFDVPDGTGTPLYTGVYSRRRRDAMEELLRFYRHFGLTLSGTSHDLPDYVPTVLEFLGFLSLRMEMGEEDRGAALALADILERHLGPWARETQKRIAGRTPHPFYAGLVELIGMLTDGELKWLRAEKAG